MYNGKCCHPQWAKIEQGKLLHAWPFHLGVLGAPHQHVTVERVGLHFIIMLKHLAFDVCGGNYKNNTKIVLWAREFSEKNSFT